jgi:hypothetical protein
MRRMRQLSKRGTVKVWLVAAGLLVGLSRASAGDTEVRDFAVKVDGKAAGTYQMTIARRDDGTARMTAQSSVRVNVLGFPVYTYNYRGEEIYKGDKLQQFHAAGAEKGVPFAVTAELRSDGLHVNHNGELITTQPDVWLTSYWHQPDPSYYKRGILLMGCDSARQVTSDLEYVGVEPMHVAGQAVNCSHCRVTNTGPVDLWYDAQRRLVREESTTDGHQTVIELVRVKR